MTGVAVAVPLRKVFGSPLRLAPTEAVLLLLRLEEAGLTCGIVAGQFAVRGELSKADAALVRTHKAMLAKLVAYCDAMPAGRQAHRSQQDSSVPL